MKIKSSLYALMSLLALATVSANAQPPAPNVSATLTATFYITLVTTINTSTQEVFCSLSASVEDSSGTSYTESSYAIATAGSPYKCVVSIPVAWYLANAAKDTMAVTYVVGIEPTSLTTTASTLHARTSSSNVIGIKAAPTSINQGTIYLGPVDVTL